MIHTIKTSLESRNRWFVLATLGTVLFFSAFLLAGISPYFIVFSIVPLLFSPAFLVVTTWRYGPASGLYIAGLSSLFLLVLFHVPTLAVFVTQFAVVGLLLGDGLRRKVPIPGLLLKASVISTLLFMAAGAAYFMQAPQGPEEILKQANEAIRLHFQEQAERFQLDPEEAAKLEQGVESLVTFAKTTFPALLLMNAFSIVYLNLLLPLFLAAGLGLDRSHVPPLKDISLPFAWIWGLIVSGLLYLLKVPALKWVGLNVALVFLLAYLMQGYAVLSFYLNKFRLPGVLKGLVYLLCLFNVSLMIALCAIGLFDTWFQFRKRPSVPRPKG